MSFDGKFPSLTSTSTLQSVRSCNWHDFVTCDMQLFLHCRLFNHPEF